jgi:hypothetical protein
VHIGLIGAVIEPSTRRGEPARAGRLRKRRKGVPGPRYRDRPDRAALISAARRGR